MKDREPERQQVYIPPEGRGMSIEQEEEREVMGGLLDSRKRKEWEHFTPEFVDTQSGKIDIDSLAKQHELARKVRIESKLGQEKAKVRINTNLPVSITHIGDTHIGSVFTDIKEVMRKVNKVMETPNAYAVFMGNMIDNAIPAQFPNNMLNNTMPPDKQVAFIQAIVKKMDAGGKLLAAIETACHEGWAYKHAGQDVNRLIYGYEGRKFPVMENGGELEVEVGEQKYKGKLFHQMGPFESNFNKTHANKQLVRLDMREKPDWVAGAHRHIAATENVYEGQGEDRKQTVYLRTGTEKGTGELRDKFVVDKRGSSGEPTGQTIHLFPKDRRILSTLDFDDAMMAHESFYLSEMAKRDADHKKRWKMNFGGKK